jgi:hypothetical protein
MIFLLMHCIYSYVQFCPVRLIYAKLLYTLSRAPLKKTGDGTTGTQRTQKYRHNVYLQMEVLFALGLAVGGVDGVNVVEDLIHIHLPVAEDVPVVDGAEVPLLVPGVVDVLVVLLRVLLPHPVRGVLLNHRTKITRSSAKNITRIYLLFKKQLFL